MKKLMSSILNIIYYTEEFSEPSEPINFEKEWIKYSHECKRIENLFNNELDNTGKHIEYMNALECIRKDLKRLVVLEHKYSNKKEK